MIIDLVIGRLVTGYNRGLFLLRIGILFLLPSWFTSHNSPTEAMLTDPAIEMTVLTNCLNDYKNSQLFNSAIVCLMREITTYDRVC